MPRIDPWKNPRILARMTSPVIGSRLLFGLAIIAVAVTSRAAAPLGSFNGHIAVDQFGYLPEMEKTAVLSDPQQGFNANDHYRPGDVIEVRTVESNSIVFAAAPLAWHGGATDPQSGDRAWWFDFSVITNSGEYYVFDPLNRVRSARFRIGPAVYEDVLKQAVRMFYYQRRGTAKRPPYADARWTDGTNFLGPLQDSECRLVTNPTPATQRDLRGGWFDAGDYNKYVNFTLAPISDLLTAYRMNPGIWPDNWNIPESGNGIPDLLDEVKWELDWLLRMQNPDGSVLSKVGDSEHASASPPSTEHSQMFYGAESTTSTLTAAGDFAQAADLYESAGMAAYGRTLRAAAVAAWNWAGAHPAVIFTNTGFLSADPEVDRDHYAAERDQLRIRAAVFLYALTREPVYRSYVESNYEGVAAVFGKWWDVYHTAVQDALLYFSTLPDVSPPVATKIREAKQISIGRDDYLGAWTSGRDPYRAFLVDDCYHWGSNAPKSNAGLLFAEHAGYRVDPAGAAVYRRAAAGYLHYLHGVNPLAMVYLSNMREHGAENCVNSIYHSWFAHGTKYENALTAIGPAPGYVPGGANKNFHPADAYTGPPLVPPMDQPPQKAYRDWNTSWPEDSWEVTEPSLSYQGPYVFLLSFFVPPAAQPAARR